MKIALFDAKKYDKVSFDKENTMGHEIKYIKERLNVETIKMAQGYDAVCAFVNDEGNKNVLAEMSKMGIKVWLQRSIGFDRVDLKKAKELGIEVFRVPNYSSETVAEFAMVLLLTLNRNIQIATNRTKQGNFLIDGLQGKCIKGSTFGVIGSGKIGQCFIKIAKGMGGNVIVYDDFAKQRFPELAYNMGFEWGSLEELLKKSDFISLHVPLLPTTKHLINKKTILQMRDDVIIVNASRGGLIDTKALVEGLELGKIKAAGLDVLESEKGIFFTDKSADIEKLKKDNPELAKLMEMENVIITSHQAFFSTLALKQIASITLANATLASEKKDATTNSMLKAYGRVIS